MSWSSSSDYSAFQSHKAPMDETELPLVRPANDRLGEPSGMPVARSPLDRRSGPTKFTVNIPESYPPQTTSTYPPKQGIQTKASRWSTIEFKVYGVVFAIVVPLMIWIPIRLSQGKPHFRLLLPFPPDWIVLEQPPIQTSPSTKIACQKDGSLGARSQVSPFFYLNRHYTENCHLA